MVNRAWVVTLVVVGCGTSEPRTSTTSAALDSCIDVVATGDTTISAAQPRKTFGSKKSFHVGDGDEGLLAFDVSSIPGSAVVSSATLTLYVSHAKANQSVTIHRATAAWSEADVTFASFAQHFEATPIGSIVVQHDNVRKSVDLTDLAGRWVNGTLPNDGVLLASAATHDATFVSHEGGTAAQHPILHVCYATAIDHCASGPCVNGTCSNTDTGFSCACEPGYTGNTCAIDIDDCAGNPCQHGGACTDGVDGYTCSCPAGYTGPNCEIDIDECAPNPCQHEGVCTDEIAGFTCTCPVGYTGPICETLVDSCAAAPCQHGGTCTNGVGTYTCSCPAGFAGANCEINIDDCTPDACHNGGTCVDGVASFTCVCPPDWGGATCDVNLNSCAQHPCFNGATCSNTVGGYTCACAPGFTGTNCEVDIDDCVGDPCEHGGMCIDGVNSYACSCADGFSGPRCEADVDECAAVPCLNAATCLDGIAQYTCVCEPDFSGPTCAVSSIELTGTLRDFHSGAEGFVLPYVAWLTASHDPALSFFYTSGEVEFARLWNDVPGTNLAMPYTLTLSSGGQSDPHVYSFESPTFYPLDGLLFGNEGASHNHYFTFEAHSAITYEPGTVLDFDGGGSLVVYVDGDLVPLHLDLDARFAGRAVPGQALRLDVFYAETDATLPGLRIQLTRATPDLIAAAMPHEAPDAGSLYGTAQVDAGGVLRLVPDGVPNVAGAAWAPLSPGAFRVDFDVAIPHDVPSEGFAVVFARLTGVGGTGARLGYEGVGPSTAIEFDYHQDAEMSDQALAANGGIISVHTRGPALPNVANEIASIGFSPTTMDLFDDLILPAHVWITFDPPPPGETFGWLRVYADDNLYRSSGDLPLAPKMQAQITDVGGASYVGLTTSTGATTVGAVSITHWSVTSPALPAPPRVASAVDSGLYAPPAMLHANETGSVVVVSRDAQGLRVTTGGAAITAILTNGSTIIPAAISDRTDGTYRVSYTPPSAGTWFLFIRIGGADISGGPFRLSVLP